MLMAKTGEPGKTRSWRLMTEEEVSDLLCLSLAAIRKRRRLDMPPKFIKIGASVRYRPEDVDAFIEGGGGR